MLSKAVAIVWKWQKVSSNKKIATAFLVFHTKHYGNYSDGNLPNGGVKWRWGIKNHDFRPLVRFISEILQDMATVIMERQ